MIPLSEILPLLFDFSGLCPFFFAVLWFQVEASTDQVTEQQGTPLYNLPWKIPCKVMNTELKVVTPCTFSR
jgi:hypothetical protein